MTFQFFLLIVLILVLRSFHVEGDIIGIVAASYQDLSDKQPVRDVPCYAKFIKIILHGYICFNRKNIYFLNTTATPFMSAIQHNSLLINYNGCYVFTYGLTC
jgi:hypothetical protein